MNHTNSSVSDSSSLWQTVRANVELRHRFQAISPISRSSNIPLSFTQQRLWLLHQLQPNNTAHNMCSVHHIKGELNIAALEDSFCELIRRHEIFRTTFATVDGEAVQIIAVDVDFQLPVIDLQNLSETEGESKLQQLISQAAKQPFDLTGAPPWRFKLVRLTNDEYILIRVMHHIISDGWSGGIFRRELSTLYDAFSAGKPSPLPKLPIQYADFAAWQRKELQGERWESLIDYWKQQFTGEVLALQLPIDFPRSSLCNYQSATQYFTISENLTTAIKALSKEEGVSLFVTLLTAFKALLFCYSGQTDLLVTSPVANRHRPETKKLIGYFNNILALRTDLSGNPSFQELLHRVSQVILEAQQHQDLPFQTLSEFPNLARIPLNRATFILQNTPLPSLELAGIAVKPLKKEQETADFELFLSMRETLGEIKGQLQYRTNLFEESTIAQMVANFQILLESIIANPAQFLDSLPVNVKNNTFVPESDKSRYKSPVTFIAPRDELEGQLTKSWEKVLGIQPISITDNFFDLGGHSMLAVRLFAEIEKIFGKNIPLVTLFQTPTIEQLASIFRAQASSGSHSCIVPIKPDGCQPPFFFIGSIGYAQKLAPYLTPNQPFFGLSIFGLPQREQKDLSQLRIEDIAEQFLKDIRSIQPHGPYLLVAYCRDASIAWEMAQQLHIQGEEVAQLAFIDVIWHPRKLGLSEHWHNLVELGIDYILKKVQREVVEIQNNLILMTKQIRSKFDSQTLQKEPTNLQDVNLIQAYYQSSITYVPQVYPGKITLFLSKEWQIKNSPALKNLAGGGLDIQEIPGYHHFLFEEPYIQVLAEKLTICLDQTIALKF